jgi:hypothetical protein
VLKQLKRTSTLHSPSCLEGFFSETGLPPNNVLGNSKG